jgi:hypothetical protein
MVLMELFLMKAFLLSCQVAWSGWLSKFFSLHDRHDHEVLWRITLLCASRITLKRKNEIFWSCVGLFDAHHVRL